MPEHGTWSDYDRAAAADRERAEAADRERAEAADRERAEAADRERAEAADRERKANASATAPPKSSAPVQSVIRPVRRGGTPQRGWPVYAVLRGRQTGIFFSSAERDAQVLGFPDGVGFGFRTVEEGEEWLALNGYTG
ncbi:hypothetical protein FA95DRAFT_1609344 [Auriscalpium vulgare]|uniref:Uncharacterized protein n=1 Tax=Auriscalpium vulgare TaxID=40419 RepID=A0ACB8RHT3_9AGAM|nr:hypothetical protein FA95DRAFT_1609344 [Auriscalpium vulgare]